MPYCTYRLLILARRLFNIHTEPPGHFPNNFVIEIQQPAFLRHNTPNFSATAAKLAGDGHRHFAFWRDAGWHPLVNQSCFGEQASSLLSIFCLGMLLASSTKSVEHDSPRCI